MLDYSTYELYYNHSTIRRAVDKIVELFGNIFRIDFKGLKTYFNTPKEFFEEGGYTEFEILTAIHIIIDESIKITNKYGYASYLKEHNNVLFLVDSLSVIADSFLADYYTMYPTVKEFISYENIIEPLYVKTFPSIVKLIDTISSLEDVRKIMIRLPTDVHEFFSRSIYTSKKEKN